MNQFNTSNSNHYTFTTDVMEFHILGGLNVNGLDRMRVTIKVNRLDNEYHALRHNIDLYNSNQVEKLVRKIAEYLEIGTSIIRRALQKLINLLEQHRLELLDAENIEEVYEYQMNQKERRQAMNVLRSPQLMTKTNKLIGASGVIGEEQNRLLMYLIFTSRLMQNPLNVISFGNSGSGKTHLQSKVASLIPEDYHGRPEFINKYQTDALLVSKMGFRMDGKSIGNRVSTIVEATENDELLEKHITPHTLRHSIATHLMQNEVPIQSISQFLGHASLESTQIYTHLVERLIHEES